MIQKPKAAPRSAPKAKRAPQKVAVKVKKAKASQSPSGTATGSPKFDVSVRMYRLGVGDCFLLTLRKDKSSFRILIDCGVHQSQAGGSALVRQVVENIKGETEGHIDVVVATHEHWDHISGFHQAADLFKDISVDEVWVAWTEDSNDAFARSLKDKKTRALAALGFAESRFSVAGRSEANNPLSGLLGFFGDTTGAKLQKAAAVLKKIGKNGAAIRYREPGEAPIELPGLDARIFVLGPPRDKAAINRSEPRKGKNEVYSFGAYGQDLDAIERALQAGSTAPFDSRFAIPLVGTKAIPFFQKSYWADRSADPPRPRMEPTQDWRRIDDDWLDAATALGLKLDEDTNNTSLVLALELGPPQANGPVLLFAADAQVGNWLSWQDVEWKDYKGRRITGPDLLRRTILYKVGHHASHNATLKALGLEMMDALNVALVPTDDEMAKKVGWGTLPWPGLLTSLEEKTGRKVIRSDRPLTQEAAAGLDVEVNDLYYQINI
ncbi:MAG: MBL fold metallo-hydrolase [Reyranella sp.]|nr:MAG: MBL fold metallo-hydrolase [Reyranella sp.]